MKLYKLTDMDGKTQNDIQWGEKVAHSIPFEKQSEDLCTSGILHAYKNINLALLLNPKHARIFPFQLWEAKGIIVAEDWGKVGCHKLTTIKEIPVPTWYQNKKFRKKVQILFMILCTEAVIVHFEKFDPNDKRPPHNTTIQAAKDYLNADAVNEAANEAARAVARFAAYVFDKAARAVADAAYAANEAAYVDAYVADAAFAANEAAYVADYVADAAFAANEAAFVANEAAYAADYATLAADYATRAADMVATSVATIDFAKLADMAVEKINRGETI